jgi:antitoxin (DNA-binding transcriptional repressor) of toxin-antitoxin stability system
MPQVNMLEAKTQLSRLVEAIESGKESEIVLARNGKPVARIVGIESGRVVPRRLGLHNGELPDLSLEEFNAADAEIAAAILDSPLFPDEPPARMPRRNRR